MSESSCDCQGLRGLQSNIQEAELMLDLFTSVGALIRRHKTNVEQKRIWGKSYSAAELRDKHLAPPAT
jgi:hypothetical protein